MKKTETSKEFASSRVDKKLLRYLVESTLAGKTLKETTIAFDVFEKGSDFNPGEDSSVRSHIYSVQKKLGPYYANEGASDPIKFVIPKGQYHVSFRHVPKFVGLFKKIPIVHVVWGAITALVLIAAVYLWIDNCNLRTDSTRFRENPIFVDFLQSELPTLIVVGDYYFYHTDNLPYADIARLTKINSDAEFDEFITENPEADQFMQKEDNSYFGQVIAHGLPHVLYELNDIRSRVKIRLASKLNYNDLRENNIIFLGSLKTLGILSNVMADMQIRYGLQPNRVILTDADGDTTDAYPIPSAFPDHFEWTDYAIAAKLRGSSNNTILIISTFNSWDSGSTIKQLTDVSALETIQTQFFPQQTFPTYFEMLFKVNGFQRTSLVAEVQRAVVRN